ncbi:MAG: hypothetical protein WKG01_24320 [Kofleriaceae bacterium]
MRRSPSSLALVALVGCGSPPAPVAPRACPTGAITLAGQDDVAALAGCERIASLAIRTAEALDLAPLASLTAVAGDVSVGPTVGLSELALRGLREVGGTVKIAGNANLMGVFLPVLVRAGGFDIGGNAALTTVSLPTLEGTRALALADNPALELLDLSRLLAIEQALVIADNGKLVLVDFPSLTRAGSVRVENDKILPDEQAAALRKLAP